MALAAFPSAPFAYATDPANAATVESLSALTVSLPVESGPELRT